MTTPSSSATETVDPVKKSGKMRVIGPLLRWGLAIILLVVVVKSGKLSPDDLRWFREQPLNALFYLSIVMLATCISLVRWWRLLWDLGLKMRFFTIVKLGMTGAFFSTILPGTVGGDLVKGVFIARRFPHFKTRAVTSMVVDRLCGLTAVLFLGAVSLVIGWKHIFSMNEGNGLLVRGFAIFLALLGLGLLAGLAIFPTLAKRLPATLPRWTRKIPKVVILDSFYSAILDFRLNPFALWRAVALSVLVQGLSMTCYWLLARQIFGAAPWGSMATPSFVVATVLGLCAMQIPVAPMGLGIGQAAFSTIFFALGAPTDRFGSALITSMQVFQILINLSGAAFFATYKHEIDEHARPTSG